MTDNGNKPSSTDAFQETEKSPGPSAHSYRWTFALGIGLFIATEIGYLANILKFDETRSLLALLSFSIALFATYFVSRFTSRKIFSNNTLVANASLLVVSAIVGILSTLFHYQIDNAAEGFLSFAPVMASSFLAGAMMGLGLLRWYHSVAILGEEASRFLTYCSLSFAAIVSLIILWFETPVRIMVFDQLNSLSYAVFLITCLRITRDMKQTKLQPAQPSPPAIHLDRNVHLLLFSYMLVLGYCLSSLLGQWTAISISLAAFVTIALCLISYLVFRKLPSILGFFGEITLPVCLALLFLILIGGHLINQGILIIALSLIMYLAMLNVFWLIRSAAAFQLDRAPHIIEGRLPSIAGFACGVLITTLHVYLPLPMPTSVPILISCFLAVTVSLTYALIPYRQGVPVKEGIIYDSDGSLNGITPISPQQRTRPFKQKCDELSKENGLTPREQEVLFLLACGYNSESIARILIVSVSTIKTHVYRIYRKLSIHNQQDLIKMMRPIVATPTRISKSKSVENLSRP